MYIEEEAPKNIYVTMKIIFEYHHNRYIGYL